MSRFDDIGLIPDARDSKVKILEEAIRNGSLENK